MMATNNGMLSPAFFDAVSGLATIRDIVNDITNNNDASITPPEPHTLFPRATAPAGVNRCNDGENGENDIDNNLVNGDDDDDSDDPDDPVTSHSDRVHDPNSSHYLQRLQNREEPFNMDDILQEEQEDGDDCDYTASAEERLQLLVKLEDDVEATVRDGEENAVMLLRGIGPEVSLPTIPEA